MGQREIKRKRSSQREEGGSKKEGKTLGSNLYLWPDPTSQHTWTHPQGFVIGRLREAGSSSSEMD